MERGQYGNKREITRDRILSAAVKLFAERGLSLTSAKEIASLAGVSVGLMYHYYKSKEEVFGELVKISLTEAIEISTVLNRDDCPKTILEELAGCIISELKDGYEFSQWTAMFSHPLPQKHGSEWATVFIDYYDQFITQMTGLIKKGQKAGVFKDGDPVMMAQYFVGAFDGICCLQLSLKEKFIPPTQEVLTAAIIKEGIIAC